MAESAGESSPDSLASGYGRGQRRRPPELGGGGCSGVPYRCLMKMTVMASEEERGTEEGTGAKNTYVEMHRRQAHRQHRRR